MDPSEAGAIEKLVTINALGMMQKGVDTNS